jgi:flagellar secretion chaperone FliS
MLLLRRRSSQSATEIKIFKRKLASVLKISTISDTKQSFLPFPALKSYSHLPIHGLKQSISLECDTMNMRQRALASYGDVKITTGVSGADNIQLIQMLFDGLIESLSTAKGHIENGAIIDKSKAIARAGRIVVGLQGALDFEKGGDIARNLNELYSYVTRRLFHVNAHNDLAALAEIHDMMEEIRKAWQTVPSLVPPSNRTFYHN